MTIDSLQRPDLKPRLSRSVLWTGGLLTFGLLSALAGHHLHDDAPVVVPIVTPVFTPMQVASPEVTVTMPAAPDPVIPPAPTPAKPRALAPTLDPACVLPAVDEDPTAPDDGIDLAPSTCDWDDGFPAISADGSTIVTKFIPDDGGRGNPGLSIRFIDTRTSKLVRDALVLSPDEVDNADRAKLQAKIAQRASAIQRSLDNYRALAPLGTNHVGDNAADADTTKLHAEFAGEVVRIVDPATATAVWRHDFTRPAPKRSRPAEEDLCGGWIARTISLHHDSSTGYVLATQTYDTGGCMCTSETITTVARIP
jgi:hypothetical protein